jgi:hypothetical protein
MRRFFPLLFAMLLTGISTSSQTVTVASSFFAITQNSYAAGHNTVGIKYGVLRFWNTNCVWSLIETSPGTYNWANCDTQINRAIAMNAAPDFVMGRTPLSHVTGSCTGTFSGSSGCAQLPSDLSTTNAVLPAFITALYNHMHTNFPSVKWSIEGVNEADLAGECAPSTGGSGHCSMVELVLYQRTIYQTLKALDSTITVLGPAASTFNRYGPHLYGGTDTSSAPFTGAGFLNAGGGAYLDVINMHPYFFCGTPAVSCTVPENAIGAISALTPVLANYGVQNKPIIASESDWGSGAANTQADNLKAAYLGRLYAYFWNAGYQGVWWYAWDDHSDNLSAGFGTLCVGTSGSCTPNAAATAYATWYNWLVGSTHTVNSCNTNVDGNSSYYCPLTLADGRTAAIVFNSAGSFSFSTTGSGFTTQYFQDGTSSSISGNSVTIGLQPILLSSPYTAPPTSLSATVN